ncbi:hypothetical protein DES40_0284 [Litorimonas taeanensis]|uniref:DUF721 domain-containing protein n=1 Tax=Litorimonas taeanensis TaxID=568099 RepID=A0A420WJ01_9PROT|nr:DciA family protein [Litorimonas taeanensis]RKQ70977.1 hypothetical protein DES40_0284 [Litorimonas taeanensis]
MPLSRNDTLKITHWLEHQRAKPQYRTAPSAGYAVSKVLRPLSKKHGGGSSALALGRIWPEIVGERWSKISTPVRFTYGRHGRTLVISAPGAAAALIMAASGPIIDRLNTHLGPDHVKAIKMVQTKMRTDGAKIQQQRGLRPTEAAALKDGLDKIESQALKTALEKLGRGVLGQNKN